MSRFSPNRRNRGSNDAPSDVGASPIAGFTLIEILVALAITVMALGAIYRLSSSGLAAGHAAEQYGRALVIAESALAASEIEEPLAARKSTRRVGDDYAEDITVRPRPDLLQNTATSYAPYPYEISVEISWHEGRRVRSIGLSTIRLGRAP